MNTVHDVTFLYLVRARRSRFLEPYQWSFKIMRKIPYKYKISKLYKTPPGQW